MKKLKQNLYLFIIYTLAIVILISAYKTNSVPFSENSLGILLFIILSIITESSLVIYKRLSISPGFAIVFSSIYLFETFYAMIIAGLGMALRIFKQGEKYIHILNIEIKKLLFNVSNVVISVYCSSIFTNKFISHLTIKNNAIIDFLKFLLIPLIFLVTHTLIISMLFSILTSDSFFKIYKSNFLFGFLNIFSMAPLGYFLTYLYSTSNVIGVIVVMIIIIFTRYTFLLYIETKSKYIETIEVLMHALESRDKYTEGHSRNVARIVEMIARELKFSESKIEELKLAAYLHDVGKIGISDAILNKPGKLIEEEYNIIKQHPEIGYQIVKDIKDLGRIPEIIRYHHERYDGKGYPASKKGEELGIDVFILQLADSIDAMMTDRVYRKALSQEEIMKELMNNNGTQFHPKVVEAYLRACEKQKSCKERG
ncbi:HD-GYP domain-containing protein [Caloramator sp. CAR-1]|uniref:HD-GYP domain-containing protein n=1 Tax=Caloramator sp. CAR-1 TaxID=3062777 RepID=UPI0026E245F3|nr:HD-GYP domain-containing protein [Caloramator sp. CAR-1]MDO6355774.1 HD-GYP domain-containing protein [Caloramator sp. CAR-1]